MTVAQLTENSLNVGRCYRFEHLALPTVPKDLDINTAKDAIEVVPGAASA